MIPSPKRARTGDVAGGNTRFREGGEQRYNDYFSKPEIIAERDVDLSGLPPTFIQRMIGSRGWWRAFTGHVAPATEIVREFYSNLYDADLVNKTCKVMLRGVTFDFSGDDISNLYKLPRVTNPTFPYKYGEEPEMDTIALTLTGNKIRSYAKSLSPNDLTPEFRILNIIVAANVFPVFPISGKFTIVQSWGHFLYALKNGGEFDLANFIWDRINDAAISCTTLRGLPFGSLITRISAAKGIDVSSERRSEKGSLINIVTWNPSLSHAAIPSNVQQEERKLQEEDSAAHPCEEEEERPAIPKNVLQEQQPEKEGSGAGRSGEGEEIPIPAPVPASDQSDLFALLGSLATQMTSLGTQIAGVHQYVRQIDSRLTQRLDLLEARLVTVIPHADKELLYQRYR